MGRERLMKIIGVKKVDPSYFYLFSPISRRELESPCRKFHPAIYRKAGMIIYYLSGHTLEASAKRFNRDHSTASYVKKTLLNGEGSFLLDLIKNYVEFVKKIKS